MYQQGAGCKRNCSAHTLGIGANSLSKRKNNFRSEKGIAASLSADHTITGLAPRRS
jgi:hypothetical protein